MLNAQADAAHRAALVFQALTADSAHASGYATEADRLEKEADEITHRLTSRVDSTFVTPLDKEDLTALSSGLDDITDLIEATVARWSLYNIGEVRPDVPALVSLLVQITEATQAAIQALNRLKSRDALGPLLIRIHSIENESDAGFRNALANLMNSPSADPVLVMKWKEMYDRIEMAVDKCESVANIVESVAVKNA